MLEYWIAGMLGFKFGKCIFYIKLELNPVKSNPLFHYSTIPLFQYSGSKAN